MKIKMYERPNGKYGVRNRIAVIPSVACVNHIAQSIANAVETADAYVHPYGCDQLGYDKELSQKCLELMGIHPNNGAVLVIGLGCEEILPHELYENIKKERPDAELIVMQEEGGTEYCINKGIEICRRFEKKLREIKRVMVDISNLTVGVECGGSDFSSGIASNPAVGKFSERLCSMGGRIVFGETTELMGSENIIKELSRSEEIYSFIIDKIKKIEDTAVSMKVDLRGTQPSPGNIDGGLSTIEEKSLGSVCKIGRNKICDAIEFGSQAVERGVTFVDTPGNDMACSLGLCCAGAQIIIFTTGRGTPMGFAAAPVIKVTANEDIVKIMDDNFDVDLSKIINGEMSVDGGGEILFKKVIDTAEGKLTSSERLGHREFSLYRVSPILT
ncbi:MAG: UxaA family hydrolase [Clostridia bacterium]|nr:UxaA family hydrolase [Clostridia bacterium]